MNIVDELKSLGMSTWVGHLIAVANGSADPPTYSRLGAFKATLGYDEGTVGHGANLAIAGIYAAMGTLGEDKIGIVFNSPEAQALFDDPANGPSSKALAEIEYAYWQGQDTIGGYMGSAFNPTVRDWIQWAFSNM